MDPSLDLIKASDGSGNASQPVVQAIRAPAATTIDVDTVAGIPATFFGSMGTPHTFVDPVTSETITVISEATAVDFRGHVDGSDLEIDEIAPGYADNGSAIGDIIVIRPITEWANNIERVLAVEHNDDGTHSNITADSIVTDSLTINGAANAAGWAPTGVAVNSVVFNGNGSYDLTMASTMANVLSPGMRLKSTRTVAAPTQCTDLDGSTQYYSKTSPNKLTFTDDFTTMGWVKLESYGAINGIIARRNGTTEGWSLALTTTGQVECVSARIAANNRSITSYQTIPLNRWVHVAATMNNSANTHTMYINGVSVAFATVTTGTITALVQGTTALVVGAQRSDGTGKFNGKIAQASVWDTVLSGSDIRAYFHSQSLIGNEANLLSAYSFNNSIADLNTTTPNDLTPQGSAVATNADSPFGRGADGTISSTLDYGIVTKVATTTVTVQVPEGCTIPTSGGVTTLEYSTVAIPFGFPAQRERWAVRATFMAGTYTFTASPNGTTFYSLSYIKLNIPLGNWLIKGKGHYSFDRTAGGSGSTMAAAISASASVVTNPNLLNSIATAWSGSTAGTQTFKPRGMLEVQDFEEVAAATDYFIILKPVQAGSDCQLDTGPAPDTASATTYPPAIIEAHCAYL